MELPKNEGGNFTPAPAGTHAARCVRFIDMGSHEQVYQGESKGLKRLVLLTFELPTEMMEATDDLPERPFTISKRYTWSMHEKSNLRHDLESWRGKKFNDSDLGPGGFNVKNLLGVPATITITHDERDGRVYTNIASIGSPMKGMQTPDQISPSVYVSLQKDLFDQEAFDQLHENLQEKLKATPEWQKLTGEKSPSMAPDYSGREQPPHHADLDDEISF